MVGRAEPRCGVTDLEEMLEEIDAAIASIDDVESDWHSVWSAVERIHKARRRYDTMRHFEAVRS